MISGRCNTDDDPVPLLSVLKARHWNKEDRAVLNNYRYPIPLSSQLPYHMVEECDPNNYTECAIRELGNMSLSKVGHKSNCARQLIAEIAS